MQMTIHNLSKLPVIDYRSVQPLQGNLKDLDQVNHDKLLRVLTKRGFTTPFFIWRNPEDAALYLMDGHQRQRVMTKNDLNDDGSYMVPYVLIPGKDEKEAKEQLLEITSQYGHMTMEGLDEFAFDLDLSELDVHFDALDLDKFLDSQDEEVEEDEAPEVDEQTPPVSQLGEVYQLGAHRLMCGDSTSMEAVERLMDGAKADMVFTDPPYGVDIVSGSSTDGGASPITFGSVGGEKIAKAKTYSKIIGDDTTDTARKSYEILRELGIDNFIIWGGNYFTDFLPPRACWVIWDKQNTGNFADVEMAWTSFGKAAKLYSHMWNGMSREGSHQEELSTRVHPTQKPVGMQSKVIRDFTEPEAKIIDLFGGSGSTLIACEQTSRVCYMMELDPKYCDVIRKRFAKLVGEEENWEAATPVIAPLVKK